MAQKRYRQGPWPPTTDDQPVGYYVHPDGYLRSDRPLAGPLRLGTEPRIGPRGPAIVSEETRISDFGMDRIDPREFDPMGTALERYPEKDRETRLCSEEIRGRAGRRRY